MQKQPISPKSASKKRLASEPAAPRAQTKARRTVRKVAIRKILDNKRPSSAQESSHVHWSTPFLIFSEFFWISLTKSICPCLLTFTSLQASTEDTSSDEVQADWEDSSPEIPENIKDAPPQTKVTAQTQPDSPQLASRKRPIPEPIAPRAPIKARQQMSAKRIGKEKQTPSLDQEASQVC